MGIENFSKNPALDAYIASLTNLGLFVTDDDRTYSDEEGSEVVFTFDDIELSQLGRDLAQRFHSEVCDLSSTRQLSTRDRVYSLADLEAFGGRAGLCELSSGAPSDRELLRDIFFRRVEMKGESHKIRRESLLLILELCRQLGAADQPLNGSNFAVAVYFGEVANNAFRLAIHWPPELVPIAMRWRMFYFHHFMSVALEGLFSCLVSQLCDQGLAGGSIESLVDQMREPSLRSSLAEVLGVEVNDPIDQLTPAALYKIAGICEGDLDDDISRLVDRAVPIRHPFAEDSLEAHIRSPKHCFPSIRLALPLVLLSTTLARYQQWAGSAYGNWLAANAHDAYLDLVPPLVGAGLTRRFGDWWHTPFVDLGAFILNRYVVQQHQAMSYEKTWTGDRCLLDVDGPRIVATGRYDDIGMGNPRLRSAIQILTDLGLVERNMNGIDCLTHDGEFLLKAELEKEGQHEIP